MVIRCAWPTRISSLSCIDPVIAMTISMIILSLLLACFGIWDICIRIRCIEISAVFGTIFLLLTVLLIAAAYYFPIRYALKTKKKRYLLFMLIPLFIFLVQIVFRDRIMEVWQELFLTMSPNLPSANDLANCVVWKHI